MHTCTYKINPCLVYIGLGIHKYGSKKTRKRFSDTKTSVIRLEEKNKNSKLLENLVEARIEAKKNVVTV